MRANELDKLYNWSDLWLETDYKLVVKAFSNHKLVPWNLRNIWSNCILILSSVNFVIHMFIERAISVLTCLQVLVSQLLVLLFGLTYLRALEVFFLFFLQ